MTSPSRRTRTSSSLGETERGVTVLEMLVAFAIVAILSGLAAAALDRSIASSKTSGAVRALRDDLELARARSVSHGTYWAICIRGSRYAGADGARNEISIYNKPSPIQNGNPNLLTTDVARLNPDDDPALPRDRVSDRHVIAGPGGEPLEFGEGPDPTGSLTIMYDLMGRPWIYRGTTCVDAASMVALATQDGTAPFPAPPDGVRLQIRVPTRTDDADTGRRLIIRGTGAMEIPNQ